MIRVCIVCESSTETEFIKSCLSPHLRQYNLEAYPSILKAHSGRHSGGRVRIERLVNFISHEYHHTDRLTTLVDFYGFQDAKGRSQQVLEQEILNGVIKRSGRFDKRFILPYIQMYEFEGLLFSDIEKFQLVRTGWNSKVRKKLIDVRTQFPTPEDINNHRETAPSKRILAAFQNREYNKKEHGPLIAEAIGLATIREKCPRFNDWVSKLEAWGKR